MARSRPVAALVMLLLALGRCPPAGAEPDCPIPGGLALTGIQLPAAKTRVVAGQRLVILALGGALTAGEHVGDTSATWPARLEADLRDALPNTEITVVNAARAGHTAADIAPSMPDLLARTGASLTIWGPGGRDVALRLDQREFQRALDDGIAATRNAGADLILMDMTWLPSPTRMALVAPYRERLLHSASENRVPFLQRYELMRYWVENKVLNLEARAEEDRLAVMRRLFACIARGLAEPIAAALR